MRAEAGYTVRTAVRKASQSGKFFMQTNTSRFNNCVVLQCSSDQTGRTRANACVNVLTRGDMVSGRLRLQIAAAETTPMVAAYKHRDSLPGAPAESKYRAANRYRE